MTLGINSIILSFVPKTCPIHKIKTPCRSCAGIKAGSVSSPAKTKANRLKARIAACRRWGISPDDESKKFCPVNGVSNNTAKYHAQWGRMVERTAWRSMLSRCHNPKNRSWQDYGGRGILVCDRWRYSFDNFYADIGKRPTGRTGNKSKFSLDRINNEGNYEPGNCRWATTKQQMNNRRKFKKHKIR